jgi:pimeloyl-ACP methyl ester carboxylesterase
MTVTSTEEPITVRSGDGVAITCWRTGAGPPLVLLHGTGEDHRRWSRVAARLAEDFTVYAVDRRGRGGSGDADTYSLAAEVADVVAVVRRIGGSVVLIGHSYGALCALEAAVALPGLVRMVLYDPPVPVASTPGTADLATRIRNVVADGDEQEALCLFLTDMVGIPRQQVDLLRRIPGFGDRTALSRTLAREIEATRRYVFTAGRFRGVRTPVLLLAGERSAPDLRDAGVMLDAALPDSRVEILPGQGHQAIDTGPGVFLDAVRRFLLAPGVRPS